MNVSGIRIVTDFAKQMRIDCTHLFLVCAILGVKNLNLK